ncbi:MAG: hypothetical protein ACJZ4H_02515 [Candidatus Pelagibacter sp.]
MILENFKFRFIFFIIFTIFLLIEGFIYYFSYKLSYFCIDELAFTYHCKTELIFDRSKSGFNSYIWDENGIVEIIQILLLFFTLLILFKIIKISKQKILDKFFIYLLYLYFICLSYFFLEEISWGQHFINWESNNFFLKYNNQGETNIHNISNLFDQLPRGLLTLWCGLSFIIFKYLSKFSIKNEYLQFILPKKELKYVSFILIIFFVPDLIIDKLNFHPGHANYTVTINLAEIYDFISFNFIRLSEYQELIFTFYLYNHALFFIKYLNHKT